VTRGAASRSGAFDRPASASVAVAIALGVALAIGAGRATAAVALLATAAVLALAVALRGGGHGALAVAVLLLAAAYAVRLDVLHARLDIATPLVAAALALVAELGSWSLRARVEPVAERAVVAARARGVALIALGGATLAGVVLAAATVDVGSSPVATVVGAAAAAALLTVAVLASR
jgi:hypothetical protein